MTWNPRFEGMLNVPESGLGPRCHAWIVECAGDDEDRIFTTREHDLHELERTVTAIDRSDPRPIIRAIYLGRIANAEGETYVA